MTAADVPWWAWVVVGAVIIALLLVLAHIVASLRRY